MGRTNSSIESKKLNGTYNEKRHGTDIPLCGKSIEGYPPYVKTRNEKKNFDHYKAILVARKMDNIEYADIIGMIAVTISSMDNLRKQIEKDGGFMIGATPSSRKVHPLLFNYDKYQAHLFNMLKSLGFTPDTRSKVISKKEAYNIEEPEDSFFDD